VTSSSSPFAEVPPAAWLVENRSAFAIADADPVSEGHALVVPRRLIATWWEASPDERHDLMDLVDEVKALLDERHQPDGYNVGFNAGAAAGQTVGHLHLHVIPRYAGDVADPRGGIRHVIPGKGNYLAPALPGDPADSTHEAAPAAAVPPAELFDGIADRRLLLELIRCLRDDQLDRIDLVVSFIMKSGLAQLAGRLADAIERGAAIRVLTTDYLAVTDADALARLLDMAETAVALPGSLEVRVWHDPSVSFHPGFGAMDTRCASRRVAAQRLPATRRNEHGRKRTAATGPVGGPTRRGRQGFGMAPLDHGFLRAYRQVWKPRAGEVVDLGVATEPPVQPVEPCSRRTGPRRRTKRCAPSRTARPSVSPDSPTRMVTRTVWSGSLVDLRDQVEAGDVSKDPVMSDQRKAKPERRRHDPTVGLVDLLTECVAITHARGPEVGVHLDEFGAGPHDPGPSKSLLQPSKPWCTPPSMTSTEANFCSGDERHDERAPFEQRPVGIGQANASTHEFRREHAGVHHHSAPGRQFGHASAMAARKDASSSSVNPSITMSSYRGNGRADARI